MKKQIMMLGLGVCSLSFVETPQKERSNLSVVMADPWKEVADPATLAFG